ncbi:hypothetical protein BDV30DRAFT_229036 [Aspergillus minisclerotigenes]|uniref:P-loop containing nucleoside triphosphate hydrolase protein n=1 Tax=Aspergillus minisclerotigenes TaxID=656917 RepID=A0A5N6IW45_9EURO|nr:hypothetical protein BDV30DRAFT_229036 [Aspergillus minisclerotigenes]
MKANFPTDIDRRTCRRTVPMKVLVLGLSRTGTDSIKKALLKLGYSDVYHGYTAATENPRDCEMWLDAMAAKWDGAVTDIPAAVFAKELIEAYPEAKVILTNRNAEKWHRSVQTALLKNVFHPWSSVVDTLAILTRSPNRFTRKMFIRAFTDYFQGDFQLHGVSVYESHYKMVRKMVPRENLLEYQIEDGWEPLCKFLGKNIPSEVPFPNGNDTLETTNRIWALVNSECQRLLGILLRVLATLVLLYTLRAGSIIDIMLPMITAVKK